MTNEGSSKPLTKRITVQHHVMVPAIIEETIEVPVTGTRDELSGWLRKRVVGKKVGPDQVQVERQDDGSVLVDDAFHRWSRSNSATPSDGPVPAMPSHSSRAFTTPFTLRIMDEDACDIGDVVINGTPYLDRLPTQSLVELFLGREGLVMQGEWFLAERPSALFGLGVAQGKGDLPRLDLCHPAVNAEIQRLEEDASDSLLADSVDLLVCADDLVTYLVETGKWPEVEASAQEELVGFMTDSGREAFMVKEADASLMAIDPDSREAQANPAL